MQAEVTRNIYDILSQTEMKVKNFSSNDPGHSRLSHSMIRSRGHLSGGFLDQISPLHTTSFEPDIILHSETESPNHSAIPRKRCSRHGKTVEAYCFTDNVLVCLNCLLENAHKGHEVLDTDAGYLKARKTLENLLGKLRPTGTSPFRVLSQTAEQISHFLAENQRVCVRKIDLFFSEIQTALHRRREEMVADVSKKVEQIRDSLRALQEEVVSRELTFQRLEEAVGTGLDGQDRKGQYLGGLTRTVQEDRRRTQDSAGVRESH
jgi:hypothetical protein